MTNAPAHRIRMGTLQATIWRNLGENGNGYSVKVTRGYARHAAFAWAGIPWLRPNVGRREGGEDCFR